VFNCETNSFRTFGRAKGKRLSPAQATLMEVEFPKVDFGPAVKAGQNPLGEINGKVWLEIGFGGAEHLLWQAEKNPDVTHLGVEPFLNGVAKAVRGIVDKNLRNIRLHRGDARDVLKLLSDNSLERVFVLFPDPWPKARHNKRRIINEDFIADLHRVIKPGGTFRFGSDITDYVDWTLTRLKRHGGFDWRVTSHNQWRVRPGDWPSTRYLEKAMREGRSGHFFEFTRV